jgi:cytochrome c biogenesis protein CcmG/thiol:disulfide interchange protein DsbE
LIRRGRGSFLFVAGLVALAACSGGGKTQSEGDALPDLELTSLNGGDRLRTADLDDGPVVVNLWATWCIPCRTEMPALDSVAEKVGGDVRVIGVNIGDDAEDAEAFLDEVAVDFPQYLDPDGDLHASVGATGMPTTVFANDGNILDVHRGTLSEDEFTDALEQRFGVSVPRGDGP